jgi:hypothetical protein
MRKPNRELGGSLAKLESHFLLSVSTTSSSRKTFTLGLAVSAELVVLILFNPVLITYFN